MEGPALLRRPYISIFIKLCHSTFIYFILPPSLGPRADDQGGVGQQWVRARVPDKRYALAIPPYDDPSRASERRRGCSGEASFMANTG